MLQQHIKIQAYKSKELYTVSQIRSTLIASYEHFTDVKFGEIYLFSVVLYKEQKYIYMLMYIYLRQQSMTKNLHSLGQKVMQILELCQLWIIKYKYEIQKKLNIYRNTYK